MWVLFRAANIFRRFLPHSHSCAFFFRFFLFCCNHFSSSLHVFLHDPLTVLRVEFFFLLLRVMVFRIYTHEHTIESQQNPVCTYRTQSTVIYFSFALITFYAYTRLVLHYTVCQWVIFHHVITTNNVTNGNCKGDLLLLLLLERKTHRSG